MRKGFTLLELIVVIIIIGILGTLGFTQYVKVVERGRIAEAKTILGQMRTSQEAMLLENGARTAVIGDLSLDVPNPTSGCVATHYFVYDTTAASGTATRCAAGGTGKNPGSATVYTITLTYDTGVFTTDTPGYI